MNGRNAAGLRVGLGLVALGCFIGCSGEGITAEPQAVEQGGSAGSAAVGGSASVGGASGAGQGGVSSMGGSASGMAGSDMSGMAGSGMGSAGGSAGGAATMPPPPVCDAMRTVLQARCGNNSCHSQPRATIGDFAISMAQIPAYIDKPSVRDPMCGLIIDSENPSESLLFRKLIGAFPAPACGAFMPVTGDALSDAQIDCMESWLQQFKK
jgi:hypothetical protein